MIQFRFPCSFFGCIFIFLNPPWDISVLNSDLKNTTLWPQFFLTPYTFPIPVDDLLPNNRNSSLDKPLAIDSKEIKAVCGKVTRSKNGTDRITGGLIAGRSEFPWQAAIFMYRPEDTTPYLCSGTLINDQFVMTSTFCVQDAVRFVVYLGAFDLSVTAEFGRLMVDASIFYVHPSWSQNQLSGGIALIKLNYAVSFSDYVKPVCLATDSDSDRSGENVIISGWGTESGVISPLLRKSTTRVISNAECASVYPAIGSGMMCIVGNNGQVPCLGDSGIPMSVMAADGTSTQVGVQLFIPSAGCNSGLPHGFTRVSSYIDWIKEISASSTTFYSPVTLISALFVSLLKWM